MIYVILTVLGMLVACPFGILTSMELTYVLSELQSENDQYGHVKHLRNAVAVLTVSKLQPLAV